MLPASQTLQDGTPLKVYPKRWYMLFIFSFLSYQQSLLWITYNTQAQTTQQFFNFSEFEVNFLLAWGPIGFLVVAPFVGYGLSSVETFRKLVLFAAVLCGLAGGIRLIPLINPQASWSFAVTSIAQFLVAVAGPIVMVGPPKLSSIWFPPHERTMATAISAASNNLGSAVGYLAPVLIESVGFPWFLIIEGIHAVVFLVVIFAHFPAAPPTPPSITASAEEKFSLRDYWNDVKEMSKNGSFLLLVFIGGLQTGMFSAWQGLLDWILLPQGYSLVFIGYLGLGAILCGWTGSVVSGFFSDKVFSRRFKESLIILTGIGTACFVLFTLSFPSIFSEGHILYSQKWLVTATILSIGFIFGSTLPILYEFGVELTYPIKEASSANVLTIINNMASLVSILGGGAIPVNWINSVLLFSLLGTCIALFFIRSQYKRLDIDEGKVDIYNNDLTTN
eukprot:TRINITY_DN14242_c0_g1_i1.p1 TRINITY_DN14242_c0_g1~~TRINITY_DN14242_c0_g1_i1.p1  ORF type:complete len:448 (-),score=46.70 TRINITY_DN14242_c0_g1_i1:17-1360(-)